MLTRLLFSGVLCVALVSAAPFAITGITSFGDSLSDGGNVYILSGGLVAAPPAYGNGQFTDGTNSNPSTASPLGVWVNQLAPKLGLAAPLPSLAGGTNYAYGDSQTLSKAGPGNVIPSLNDEVTAALGPNNMASSSVLYTFWSGANDIAAHPLTPSTAVAAADDIYNQILAVAAAGGKNFLWLDLPPLGSTPAAQKLGPPAVALANFDSGAFNLEYALDVQKLLADGINVVPVDINSLFNKIISDFNTPGGCTVGPSDPYCFANIDSPAQGKSVDPNTYLFWDNDHPTTAGHALIADAAFAAIEADTSAVPEPASLALGACGLIGLSLIGRKFFRK